MIYDVNCNTFESILQRDLMEVLERDMNGEEVTRIKKVIQLGISKHRSWDKRPDPSNTYGLKENFRINIGAVKFIINQQRYIPDHITSTAKVKVIGIKREPDLQVIGDTAGEGILQP